MDNKTDRQGRRQAGQDEKRTESPLNGELRRTLQPAKAQLANNRNNYKHKPQAILHRQEEDSNNYNYTGVTHSIYNKNKYNYTGIRIEPQVYNRKKYSTGTGATPQELQSIIRTNYNRQC